MLKVEKFTCCVLSAGEIFDEFLENRLNRMIGKFLLLLFFSDVFCELGFLPGFGFGWLSLLFLAGCALSCNGYPKNFFNSGYLISLICFTASIVFWSGLNGLFLESLSWFFKLNFLFIVFPTVIDWMEIRQKDVFDIFSFYVCINALFLFLGQIGYLAFSSDAGAGRVGTLFSRVGPLGQLSAIAIVFIVSGYVKKLYSLIIFGLGLYAVFMDGSRTAFLSIIVSLGIVILNLFGKRFLFAVASSLLLLGIGFLFNLSNLSLLEASSLYQRWQLGANAIRFGGVAGVDLVRYELNMYAIDEIVRNPFVGRGIGVIPGIEQVVHNSYLGVFYSAGLLGIMSYGSLLLNLIRIPSLRGGSGVSIGVVLIAYMIQGVFHPIGVQPYNWVPLFLVIFAKRECDV